MYNIIVKVLLHQNILARVSSVKLLVERWSKYTSFFTAANLPKCSLNLQNLRFVSFCARAACGQKELVQPGRPGDPASVLPRPAGWPGLVEEPRLPRGRLEWRLLADAGRIHPRWTRVSRLCQVCVSAQPPLSLPRFTLLKHTHTHVCLHLPGSSPFTCRCRPRLW